METIVIYLVTPEIVTLTMEDHQAVALAARLGDATVINCHSEEEFLVALPKATVVCTWVFKREWFALAPKLWLVSTPAAGKDFFSVVWPEGMEHWNGSFHGEFMAETAVAMILGMTRGLLQSVTTFSADAWPRSQVDAIARPLRGSRVTICGFGSIGRWTGEYLKPFGVHIWGVSQHSGHAIPAYFDDEDALKTTDEVDALLPQTDHLLLVLPRSAETNDFLDARRLALLPSHATVTNIGRGNAINEQALVAALSSGKLAGACLDVTATEPLPEDSPMRKCPNLWIMPHASAFAHSYMDAYAREFAKKLSTHTQKN